jgi:hypothetical protein
MPQIVIRASLPVLPGPERTLSTRLEEAVDSVLVALKDEAHKTTTAHTDYDSEEITRYAVHGTHLLLSAPQVVVSGTEMAVLAVATVKTDGEITVLSRTSATEDQL